MVDEQLLDEFIDELTVVRASTKTMFENFDDEQLRNKGTNWKYKISVLAMAFNIIEHQIHPPQTSLKQNTFRCCE